MHIWQKHAEKCLKDGFYWSLEMSYYWFEIIIGISYYVLRDSQFLQDYGSLLYYHEIIVQCSGILAQTWIPHYCFWHVTQKIITQIFPVIFLTNLKNATCFNKLLPVSFHPVLYWSVPKQDMVIFFCLLNAAEPPHWRYILFMHAEVCY